MFKLKYTYRIIPVILVVIVVISLGLFGYRIFKTKSIYTLLNSVPKSEVSFTSPSPSTNKTQGALAAEARADLAIQSGIKELDISTVSVESVNWSDSSLGCPMPGTAYAQVITPGYKIILKINDKIYTYHASSTNVVLCQSIK